MVFLTNQQRAKIYATTYASTTNLHDFLKVTAQKKLPHNEAELAWETIDQYEDIKPK